MKARMDTNDLGVHASSFLPLPAKISVTTDQVYENMTSEGK